MVGMLGIALAVLWLVASTACVYCYALGKKEERSIWSKAASSGDPYIYIENDEGEPSGYYIISEHRYLNLLTTRSVNS